MIPAIKSQRLRRLLDHYLDVRGDRAMPSRRDIDATRLGPVLSIIWINEYEADAGTFRYRLAGEGVNNIFGTSVSGRLLSDFIAPGRFEVTNESFLKVIREASALVANGPVYRCTDRIAIGERLALPLSSDGVTADSIIGATECETMVDFKTVTMSQQQVIYIPIEDLARDHLSRAAGG
jgi:hypothetical protein